MMKKLFQNTFSIAKHIVFMVCRLDTIIAIALILKAFAVAEEEGFLFDPHVTFTLNLPTNHTRIMIEIINLAAFGFFERWIVLELLHFLEEEFEKVSKKISRTSKINGARKSLPLSKSIRDADFKLAQAQPWFHNKMAILLVIGVLFPINLYRTYNNKDHGSFSSWIQEQASLNLDLHRVEFEVRKLCKDLIVGLFVIDVILGTAHMMCHKGPFVKYLCRYHAQHHSRHHNYSSVKYVGNSFDFEVILTQVCYAFLPRVLGLDVWTGIFLINLFSLQLLLEHSGCTRLFALSQHHEMHHNHGNVAFYHFPLTELVLGRMPSLKQLQDSSHHDTK